MKQGVFLPGLLVCLWAASPIAAQPYGHLTGVVLDSTGGGISGATVEVVNEETGFRRQAHSQADGGYVVASLQPGLYKITVRKEGFRTIVRLGIKLDVSQPTRVDFTLPVGSMQESITVHGDTPLLNSEDASVGTLIPRDRIERLPLNGRGILSLLELAPGTVVTPATRGESGQFTANGQRPNTHYFTVDGVSVNTGVSGGAAPTQATGGALPGLTAFGSLHSVASLEALEEFRVQTSTVAPELGRLPGAQVSLSTRSGSNDFHGSVFYFFRHEKLAANDWFANRHGDPRWPLRVNDFGAGLGGPLRKNRSFFFLAYEGIRLRQPFTWRTAVPSLAFRAEAPDWAQPVLHLFPAPNGPTLGRDLQEWTGPNLGPSRLDAGSLRIDHALTSRVTLFGRYNQTPSANRFGAFQVSDLVLHSRNLTAAVDVRLRPDTVLDTRLNFSEASARSEWRPITGPLGDCALEPLLRQFLRDSAVCNDLIRFSISGVGQLTSGREGDRRQSQFHLSTTGNLDRRAHNVRLGIDYRRLTPVYRDPTGSLSVMAENVNDLLSTQNLWIATTAAQSSRSEFVEVSAFAQDTWRIGDRLTAAYGVRWEFNPPPAGGRLYYVNAEGSYIQADLPIWRTRYTNFAPRLGVAYRATNRLALRGGAGLFYDSSLSIATDVVNGGPLNVSLYTSARQGFVATVLSYGFLPGFRMPLIAQWNASAEQAVSKRDVVSVAYVGSTGRKLIRREFGTSPGSELLRIALATNHGRSGYQGLQIQYRRRLSTAFQALFSYAWSHSIDNASSDYTLNWATPGAMAARDRSSSDFDVRHAAVAAFSYENQRAERPRGRTGRLLQGWAVDGVLRARTGFPINVVAAEQSMALTFANAFRPDLVPGQPIWISDASAPRGVRLNRAAFQTTTGLIQGNLGRNALAGFGMFQADLALRREFRFQEQGPALQFRVEAFNAFNNANLADPVRFLASPMFGESPTMLNVMLGTGSPASGLAPIFQVGGARSVEVVLRVRF